MKHDIETYTRTTCSAIYTHHPSNGANLLSFLSTGQNWSKRRSWWIRTQRGACKCCLSNTNWNEKQKQTYLSSDEWALGHLCPSQGIPGRDGKDGTQGLDGEKVRCPLSGYSLLLCVNEFGMACDSDHFALCCQGDAGRGGVPGEKGPNGLPVSTLKFLWLSVSSCQRALCGAW